MVCLISVWAVSDCYTIHFVIGVAEELIYWCTSFLFIDLAEVQHGQMWVNSVPTPQKNVMLDSFRPLGHLQ